MPEPLRPVMMTTSGSPVSATFLPACFLKAIPRPVVLLVRRLRLRRAALRLVAAEHLGVARDEFVGRIVTAKAQQVHANRRLDERREVAPRTDGQNAVARLARREGFFQVLRDLHDGDGADERRLHERECRALGGLDEFGGRREPFRDEDAGDFLELKARDCFAPLLRRELAEVLQFALADYLHAPLVQVVREARERESELLYARRTE